MVDAPDLSVNCTTAGNAARRQWFGLAVIALSQLIIVVDGTIVNVALPAMTRTLAISDADRQWIFTAYALAFGGLLLVGGRVTDYIGLRRAFVVGLVGFAVASGIGGAAQNLPTMLGARALQGMFGALLAPAALALLSTTFTEAKERARAFAIFGAVAGGGSAIGLIVGGVLTEYASWRWTMFINIPISAIAVAGAYGLLDEFRPPHPGRLDLLGTALGTAGVLSLVYSFTEAERHGWTQDRTLILLGTGLSLLIVFVVSQRMVPNPVLPPRVLANRTRAGASVAVGLASAAMYGTFFFETFFMQGVLGYSPVRTGVAFLTVTGGIIVSSGVISALATRVPPRWIMGAGLLGAAAGMTLLLRIDTASTYASGLMPPLVLVGLSLGAVFVPAFNAATFAIGPEDTSVASATVNTAQQVGGSLGVALLSTVASNRTAHWAAAHGNDPARMLEGLVAGYVRASLWAALILVVAAIATTWLVDARRLVATLPDAAHAPSFHPARKGSGPSTDGSRASPVQPEFVVTRATPATATIARGTANGAADPLLAIRGLVRNSEGTPISAATLTLLDVGGQHIDRAWSDENGLFSFRIADSVQVVLLAQHEQHRPQAKTLHVPPGADIRLEVALHRAGVLSGSVLTQGTVRPVANTLVTWSTERGGLVASTRTSTTGRYQLVDLAPGAGTVAVHRPGLEAVKAATVVGASGPTVCNVAAPSLGSVTGMVRNHLGLPVADARVWLEDDSGAFLTETRADEGGRFYLNEVPAGTHKLSAVGYPPASVDLSVVAGRDTCLT